MTEQELADRLKDVGNALADIAAGAGNSAGQQIQQQTDTQTQNGGQDR
jgi:hypothetical protein